MEVLYELKIIKLATHLYVCFFMIVYINVLIYDLFLVFHLSPHV